MRTWAHETLRMRRPCSGSTDQACQLRGSDIDAFAGSTVPGACKIAVADLKFAMKMLVTMSRSDGLRDFAIVEPWFWCAAFFSVGHALRDPIQ
jgi:hypothetical protein